MLISNIYRVVMSIIYLGSGLFLLIGNNIFNFTDFQKNGLGAILIGYGIFRLYSSVKKIKETKKNEE